MRHADKTRLLAAGRQLRVQLLDSLAQITVQREQIPHLAILNPPLWELGHIGWFHEFWCLRDGDFSRPSLYAGADDLYNSTDVIHRRRWSLPLPSMDRTKQFVADVQEQTSMQLERVDGSDESLYFYRLGHFHEAMHLEAFYYSWQTLAYPRPAMLGPVPDLSEPLEELSLDSCTVSIGSAPNDGFIFDNEKWAQEFPVDSFRIASRPVTNGEFAEFVRDGGYQNPAFWDQGYLDRLQSESRSLPLYWSRNGDTFLRRQYDQTAPLIASQPVLNVSAFEAEAYCRWAGRRLPTEAEWVAATGDPRCRWGGIGWEWTATPFEPLAGFSADPYLEYSEPWFHTHRVVRGGSFATPPSMADARYRNFYEPWRADPFFGFRTCALAA